MHLVFSGDVIVGLFIPKPSPQAVNAYFWCYFFSFFFCLQRWKVLLQSLSRWYLWRNCQPSILLKFAGELLYHNCYWINAQLNLLKIIICISDQKQALRFVLIRLNLRSLLSKLREIFSQALFLWLSWTWHKINVEKNGREEQKRKGMRDWECLLFVWLPC